MRQNAFALQPLTDYRLTETLMRWSQTRVFVCESWVAGDRYPEALWNICDTENVTRWDSLLCLKKQHSLCLCVFKIEKLTYSMSTSDRKWLLQTLMQTLEIHSFSLIVSLTQTSSQKHKRQAASIGKNFIYPFKTLSEGWDLALVSYIGELWGHCVNSTQKKNKTKKRCCHRGVSTANTYIKT